MDDTKVHVIQNLPKKMHVKPQDEQIREAIEEIKAEAIKKERRRSDILQWIIIVFLAIVIGILLLKPISQPVSNL